MAHKVSMIVLKVDLECSRCYNKIRKTLSRYRERYQIVEEIFDDKQNTVTISGPFCPKKLARKLCCKARNAIKCIEIVEETPPKKPKSLDPPKPEPEPEPEPESESEPAEPEPAPAPAPPPAPVPPPLPKPAPPPPPPSPPAPMKIQPEEDERYRGSELFPLLCLSPMEMEQSRSRSRSSTRRSDRNNKRFQEKKLQNRSN
ncbi:protein PYRICULARIA ORYZAE RESISTANCE 21-like [Macadamia integrifolia]|uniref:protein PYRICULARIA ORYZAE RESISTANCE 21-like n=1 Tax=Macadamia integrifolia TaxID=60698 RepID=UPI001C5302B7|nr:protein PYRICULARIA ORYZAE RESISTANCE 21-like [Macadamia integrifolia]